MDNEKFQALKESMAEAVESLNPDNMNLLIVADMENRENPIVVLGNADNHLEVCALLTAILCNLLEELDDEDKKMVKNIVHVAMALGGSGFADIVEQFKKEGEANAE